MPWTKEHKQAYNRAYKRKKDCKRVCQYCGKEFMARRDVVKRGGGKYCSLWCNSKRSHWKGGKYITWDGYVLLTQPDGQLLREHRLVAEKMLGRPLKRREIVHHINGNPSDNRPENLQIMSQSEHQRLHHLGTPHKKGWALKYDCCRACGTTERRHTSHGFCMRCLTRKRRGSKLFTPPLSE